MPSHGITCTNLRNTAFEWKRNDLIEKSGILILNLKNSLLSTKIWNIKFVNLEFDYWDYQPNTQDNVYFDSSLSIELFFYIIFNIIKPLLINCLLSLIKNLLRIINKYETNINK